MLPGLQFDVIEQLPGEPDRVHQRTTDAKGLIEIDFPGPRQLQVRELLRAAGGQWGITSAHAAIEGHWYITQPGRALPAPLASDPTQHGGDCDDTDLWVGNARPYLPETGAGGARQNRHGSSYESGALRRNFLPGISRAQSARVSSSSSN